MRSWLSAVTLAVLACLLPAPVAAQDAITPDVVYGHKDGMALTYDVVRPMAPANGAGVVFMVSGGWVSRWSPPSGYLERAPFGALSDAGFTLFLVRHGSSPRFKVPDAIADVRRAVRHIRANASDFGVDPDRLGLTGMSAGGHLSLSVGLRSEGGDPAEGEGERPHEVAAVVAYFPPVDLRGWSGPNDRFPALDFEAELETSSSPILFATPDDPPTLLLHGDEDGLVPLEHSERMHAALDRAGVEVDFVVFEGAGHGFSGEHAERSARLTVAWFERHLLGPGTR